MKKLFPLLAIFLFSHFLQANDLNRESILNKTTHVEDSIHYHIDTLPRLCDELDTKKQMINIGDCKLYCETEGEGIPLVLINGGPGGTHHCFHPWFSRIKDVCQVIYYDQRGCGQSDFIKGDGYTFRQAIDDLDKLRQKLGVKKWIVMGYSYGGALAQYYTATYSDHVLGLVLTGAAPVMQDNRLNGSRQQNYISVEEKQKIKELYSLYREGKLNLLQLLFNKDLNGDWKRQNFLKPSREEMIRAALYEWVNDKNFNRIMGASYTRYNFKNLFIGCPIPTLLCEGKWDLTWSEQKAQVLKENHPQAKFVLFKNSGHSIYNEEPELFFKNLKAFVTTLKPIPQETFDQWKKQSYKILKPQETLFENESHFFTLIQNEGIQKGLKFYSDFKQKNKKEHLFSENGMNNLGYSYFGNKKYKTAIELFKLNVNAYPGSWNTYDSLGEAYLANGNKEKAIENYKKSIELNPENENGKKVLKELTN